MGDRIQIRFFAADQIKNEISTEPSYKISYRLPSNLLRFQILQLSLGIVLKTFGNQNNQKSFKTALSNVFITNIENYDLKAPNAFHRFNIFYYYGIVCHPYATCIYSYVICRLLYAFVYTRISISHFYVTRMYSLVTAMSLLYPRMLSVRHSYVLIFNPYVTFMYSHIVCMSLVCIHMSSICHSYEVYHKYKNLAIPAIKITTVSINRLKVFNSKPQIVTCNIINI